MIINQCNNIKVVEKLSQICLLDLLFFIFSTLTKSLLRSLGNADSKIYDVNVV